MASVSLYADQEEEENKNDPQNCKEIISNLSKDTGWGAEYYYQYQGFWYPQIFVEGIVWAQQNFRARDTDIFLASFPKCGTTWVKALMFTITNRKRYNYSSHPLLTNNPHNCIPYIEFQVHKDNPIENLDSMPSPRLLATHIPLTSLPKSIVDSGIRIVCIARNPKDALISYWLFSQQIRTNVSNLPPIPIEDAFELFCKGVTLTGPFWDHVLGYWEASLENPNKVLFLKYEDMKRDTECYVKRLAEFIGHPFSLEEEREGVVQEVIKFCSFENMSNLEVNKSGTFNIGSRATLRNDSFFRQGKVGDSKNHMAPEMLKRLDQITEQKLATFGLKF